MKNLDQFVLANNLLDELHGGTGLTTVHFYGENAVQMSASMGRCYCYCYCGWVGNGRGTGVSIPSTITDGE